MQVQQLGNESPLVYSQENQAVANASTLPPTVPPTIYPVGTVKNEIVESRFQNRLLFNLIVPSFCAGVLIGLGISLLATGPIAWGVGVIVIGGGLLGLDIYSGIERNVGVKAFLFPLLAAAAGGIAGYGLVLLFPALLLKAYLTGGVPVVGIATLAFSFEDLKMSRSELEAPYLQRPNDNSTGLMSACLMNDLPRIKSLLDVGVKHLIDFKACLNCADNEGKTALMHAASESKEAVKLLLAHHPDLTKKDNRGYTALHYAAVYAAAGKGKPEIVEALLEADWNSVFVEAEEENTILYNCILNKKYEIAELLLENCWNPNRADIVCNSKSFLHSIWHNNQYVLEECQKFTELLLKYAIGKPSSKGWNPEKYAQFEIEYQKYKESERE